MKIYLLLVLNIVFMLTLTAQKTVLNEFATLDKTALQLPDSLSRTTEDISKYINSHFKTEPEKTRAIFIWIASNIQYDIDNMFAINFYATLEEKISKPLKTRKGICENYAALFSEICSKSGIKSFVVEGYTKQNGFADYIPHAWCAARVDSSWFIFDPTWGSGFIAAGKFVKKINNTYFKSAPSVIIKSHMPFDYLWQFLNYPITNQEFYEGKTAQNTSKGFFNYTDSIQVFETQDRINQLISTSYRIEKNGVKNSMVFDRLQHIKLEIENDKTNKAVNLYNGAVVTSNEAINNFNAFIQYRNNQFIPMKSDPEIQNMIDTVSIMLKTANEKMMQISDPNANTSLLTAQLNKSIQEISIRVKEQQDWLALYLSKTKSKRKAMFYEKKLTWFGIPIN
jgi:Transglutaminase-like superfamily